MHLILTHEQADFDAVAALLGAQLMHEHAHAVLPRRMNRNVKAFLTLYGAELPFTLADDLPDEPIDTVTLVDTQSLVTLRGMGKHTAVQVVDHHQLRPGLPDSWKVTIEPTGACTTLFVEGLREHNGRLSSLHATLLLLGIYEDTGSLSYAATTARDARAVSHLLEQGGDLEIVQQYLNPPLSDQQRKLYDQVLENLETHEIHGLGVMIGLAEAPELTEEISSIAHKIRDLHDPAAFFLFVLSPEGLRLVARSTTNLVDVAGVAAHFGGGGHQRASAALVKPGPTGLLPFQQEGQGSLQAAREELLRILPNFVRPAARVRQIMSRHPLLLTPETPVDKALNLMQRYGYEGYPIVKDGKVIGLLNRRSVDRATAHKLSLSVASLMEAGEVSVQPDDSIERLRDVMIESGWGQVPVVDPQSGEVIGIVTRTDLLKQLGAREPSPGTMNLADQMNRHLPPARRALLKLAAAEARRLHQALYIVGGFVRDLLLDIPSLDFDLVVEGDAISLARSLERAYGGKVLAHSRFGTAKWRLARKRSLLDALGETDPARVGIDPAKVGVDPAKAGVDPADLPETLDLVSARTEFYDYPTALPSVERSSIKLDLHRRDFTINTMALRLDGRHYGDLYDYWGGLRDLKAGLLRVLHSLSFVDDPTRQLRAVRLEQRFGFTIEARTLELMQQGHPLIRNLSGDRLRHELNLILQEEKAPQMLARLDELGLLTAIHPDLSWSVHIAEVVTGALTGTIDPAWAFEEQVGNLPLRTALAYLSWLSPLPLEKAFAVADRLRLNGQVQTALVMACQLRLDLPALAGELPSRVTERLDAYPALAIWAIHETTSDAAASKVIWRYVSEYQKVKPITSGNDLAQMQIPPGPLYKSVLTKLRAAWLDGQVASAEQEAAYLHTLLQEAGAERAGSARD